MSFALLSINLDFMVVNLGLADMERDLDTSLSELHGTSTARRSHRLARLWLPGGSAARSAASVSTSRV